MNTPFGTRPVSASAIAVATSLALIGLSPAVADTTYKYTLSGDDFIVRNSGAVIADTGGLLEMQMTPKSSSQSGGFFASRQLDLTHSFVLDAEIMLGDGGTGGADGAAFTLFASVPDDLRNADGDGLGYSGLGPVMAVEWDTYHNEMQGDLGYGGRDVSMALAKDTATHWLNDATYAPVVLIESSTMIADDGTWRAFQIAWDGPSETITVKYDIDSDGVLQDDEIIFDAVSANLTGAGGLFEAANDHAFWGFTASTGLYYNYQAVRFGANALKVIVPPPPPYLGPIFGAASPAAAAPGDVVTISGSRLSTVSSVSIDGVAVSDLQVSANQISFTVPDVSPGMKDLVVESSFGRLTLQDKFRVEEVVIINQPDDPTTTIRRIGDTVRAAIMNVAGNGKVQIFLNGEEVGWVRADDASDPKLRTLGDIDYFVRTLYLVPGKKNVVEIYIENEKVRRVSYTLDSQS